MKNFLTGVLLSLGIFFFFDEIQDYWKNLNVQNKLTKLNNFNKEELDEKIIKLKAQIFEIQENLETKKDKGMKKAREIKEALIEAQQAISEFQQAVKKIQEARHKIQEAI